jgi:hypothetical protein
LDEKLSIDGLDKKLNSLYETPYSDIAYMNICDDSISDGSCRKLIVYESDILKHVLLFKYSEKARHITILNYYFRISLQDVEYLRDMIFDEYEKIQKITFPGVFLDKVKKSPLMVLYEQNTDKIIELPESIDIYMKSLGASTRKNIQLYQNRIAKQIPDFKTSVHEGENISRDHVAKLVELNRSRMKSKGKTSGNSDADIEIFYRYARIRGVLCLCTVNENIIGGTINFVFDEHAYFRVIAHDNAYNRYRAGQIALVATIQNMIERKMKYFHLMWGEEEYKYRFLGKPYTMYDVMVFRTYPAFFLNRILFGIRSLMKTARERLEKNATLKKLYRKIRNL